MLAENITRLRQELGHVELVVVSKYRSIDEIKSVYDCGQRKFGENRVQALLERVEALPKDIEWHLIGHLQTNKVKYIAPMISMIQSVDSSRLLDEIDKQAARYKRKIDCLLQCHIAEEETKFGLNRLECIEILDSKPLEKWPHVQIRGLMGMATNTDDTNKIENEFKGLKSLFDELRATYKELNLDTLSMGMSSDYGIAVQQGSTLVRIGSKVFES